MDNQQEFLKKLELLREKAAKQNGRIRTDEVKAFFAEDALTEEQMLLVYDYLLSQKISVAGYMKSSELTEGRAAVGKAEKASADLSGKYTSEERQYREEYRQDLSEVKPPLPGERERLFLEAAAGDALAKGRLTELYLPVVLEIAEEMYCEGIYLGDMVQEGNVSLMLALELPESTGEDPQKADLFIREEIRQGIQAMIQEHTEQKQRDKRMEQQVNDLDGALHHLADKKERAVTIDELAEYMQISEDEILDIMKLAGEDLYDKYKKKPD